MRPIVTGVLLAAAVLPFGGSAHRKNEQGNRLYREGALEEALQSYTEGQVAAPEEPALHYNIGNVLYRQGDHAGAAEAYRQALLATRESLVPDAAYNLGNATYQQQDYEEALRAYERALRARPDDLDTKRNLELTLRALEMQKQNQSSNPQRGPEGQQQSRSEPQPQPSDPGEQRDSAGGAGEGEAPSGTTREQLERLLDGVEQQEREALRHQANQRQDPAPEKDW